MDRKELRKQIGQLMVFGFADKTPSEEITRLIRDYHVGGIILFSRNIGSAEEVLELTRSLQQIAKNAGHERPLLICVDQENGIVRRLGEGTTYFPGSMLIGATGNKAYAYDIGFATGTELKALGINWNLAPVVDVNNNPDNPVIGVRSFGEDKDMVSTFAVENMRGMHDAGVITTLKHFPGHGDTDSDSHLKLPIISHNMERLEAIELKPFQACMDAGADTIMSAHVYFKALMQEEKPATLAKEVMTGLLRDHLGFEGVVTTDCMEMNAIAGTYGTVNGAIRAIDAGVDIIMISHTHDLQEKAIIEIGNAVDQGTLSPETIATSYERVMALKDQYLSWEEIEKNHRLDPVVGSPEHATLAKEVYRCGVTICKNDGVLPLSVEEGHRILFIDGSNNRITGVEDKRVASHGLQDAIIGLVPDITVISICQNPTEVERTNVLQVIEKFDKVIFSTSNMDRDSALLRLILDLCKKDVQVVVIAMRNPYHLSYMPDVNGFIATYEWTRAGLDITAKALFGMEEVTGTLPVMK